MFDRQYRLYSKILLAADVVILLPALYVAYFFRSHLVTFLPEEMERFFNPELLPFGDYLVYLLIFFATSEENQ